MLKVQSTLPLKKGKSYNVKGVLNEERQAVWVEDASTQEVVTEIVEK